MLILSTFNSDYLQKPLQLLLEKFTPEPVDIKYINKNLIVELLNLKSNLEESKSYAILFRICDFMETGSIITENKLTEHLNLLVNQITSLKHEKGLPLLVFLCPSPSSFYINSRLNGIEKLFIEKLNENKIHTLTLSDIQDKYGIFEFENPIEDDTHIPYNPELYIAMTCLLARKLHAINQKPCKVIVVDCDNTLWEGVAGDIGINHIEFKKHNIFLQNYLVDQQEKGIIICLCSKNDEQTVLEVFNQREAEMSLKLSHILKRKINWIEKSNNILALAKELNLNPDSFRFIDDNSWEINEVSQISGLLCITMPQNLKDCKSHWAFDVDEHLIITETDKKRAKFYEQTGTKEVLATQFRDPIQYLRSSELGQSISINKINSVEEISTIERVSQLSQRTNQFNLFPEFKTINEINAVINCDKKAVFVGIVQDNFTPKDAIDLAAAIIVSWDEKSLTVENIYLSCRGFNRGIEYEGLKKIVCTAQEKGIHDIKIKFKKSEKNRPSSNFLNILSDKTNTDPIARFILNKFKNYPWLQNHFKSLFKKLNICLDFNLLELDEEFVLILPVCKLMELEVDSLIRASLNVFHGSTKEAQNKKIILNSNKINEKYLIELKKLTSSLDVLVKKFFIDTKAIQSIPRLENKIKEICNRYLGEEGQDKSLVARGLDSLKATELRYYLYEINGINITIPKLLCEKTTAVSLIEFIKEGKKSSEIPFSIENLYNQVLPVSFQQKRICSAEQLELADNSANYHMTACYKVSKNLDIQRFETACQELIKFYDEFGTIFFIQDNELKQSILSPGARKLNFQVKNLETSLEEAIQLEISKPWTMQSKDPLIRFVIFETTQNYHIFMHIHHAIFDAVSLKNCLDTLSQLYQNKLTPNVFGFVDNPPQYTQFIFDQKKKLANEAYQTLAYNFWKNALSKIETVTTLPIDQPISIFKPATEQVAKRYTFSLSREDLLVLKTLAKSTGVTCFIAVNALFGLLVASYTFQKNITLITATNGRGGHPSFDKMIGFFVNLLVQTFDLEANQPFDEYLKQVNENFLRSQDFQDISFDKIQEILSTQGIKDILLSPAFIYQSYAIPELRIDNEIAELEIPQQPIIFDLRKTCRFGHFTLFAQENDQELTFVIEYAKDLFSTSFIEGFAKNFLHTIQNVCANPSQSLHEISVICGEERNQLISLSQGPQLHYVKDDNLVKRFQQMVKNFPVNPALCYGEIRLSYKELDQQSTNLAQALINAKVGQGKNVGIYLEPNHLFFVAELAALKIGAVFIPLSKEDPYDRLKSIIEDADIKFFIVDNATKGLFDTDFQASTLIPIHSVECASLDRDLPPLIKTMEDRFCILYTSGSTGKPKGVMLQEKGIFRVVESSGFVKVLPEDKIAQTANQAFDAAQFECWLAWNNGACLVLFGKETILNPGLLQNTLIAENVTHMWLTAGLFNSLAEINPKLFNSLKYLMVGGDVVYKDTVTKILKFEKSPIIINGYGPTETSIFALTYTFDKQTLKDYDTSPIGTPINNTIVKILTSFGMQAPIGAIGELYIMGDGLGSYLNLPELEERFINNPGQRAFRTGDLVRYDKKSQEIMFERRSNKQQVKINGNLVSLEEVRKNLSKHPAIKQVEIIFKKLDGFNALTAFFILHEKVAVPTKQKFRDFLSKRLPPYMLPTVYCSLADFKLNANGKLDVKWLEEHPLNINENNNSKEIEGDKKKLLKIFKEVLSDFPDNVETDFFVWGGSSIQAMLLINYINDTFKLSLKPRDLYENPTIALLANRIKNKDNPKKSKLRLFKEGNKNLPLIILFYPAGGGVNCYKEFLKEATFDNPCYVIEDPVLDNEAFEPLTMEEMASHCYEIIKEFRGPLVIGGFSFGGLLAWKVAELFETRSENNFSLKLFLFDTWAVSCANQLTKDKLIEEVLVHCAEQRRKANIDGNSTEILPLLERLCEHHQKIGFEFKPPKLKSTPVTLFQATELNKNFLEMSAQDGGENNYLLEFLDETLFMKYKIAASHYTLLANNYLAEFFSDYVNKTNLELGSESSKVNKVSTFFRPLSEINNDPQFSCLKPRTKQ